MKLRQTIIHVAALALALAAGSAYGQELQLKEADIRKLIPLLRAQAAGLGAAQALFERETAARTSFSGDPLEFFHNRAKLNLIEGLRYVPGCSRSLNAIGPIAIFTFGRKIDCVEQKSLDYSRGLKRVPNETPPPLPPFSTACSAEHDAAIKLIDDTIGAFEKMGFQVSGRAPLVGYPIYLSSKDEIFRIVLDLYNPYDRGNLSELNPIFILIENEEVRQKALAACSDMPSGPIVEVRPDSRFFEREPVDALDIALRKSGLKEEEFDAMRMALFTARIDTNPEMMRAAEALGGSDPDELRALAIRRSNADLYRKHAAELDPLLDALFPKQ
jgi:hypothetical protein